jgi:hypothetical protein
LKKKRKEKKKEKGGFDLSGGRKKKKKKKFKSFSWLSRANTFYFFHINSFYFLSHLSLLTTTSNTHSFTNKAKDRRPKLQDIYLQVESQLQILGLLTC